MQPGLWYTYQTYQQRWLKGEKLLMVEDNKKDIEKEEEAPKEAAPVILNPKGEESKKADPSSPSAPQDDTASPQDDKVKEEVKQPPKEEAAKSKRSKKINLMSLKEIEDKLKTVKEKMGNLKSHYAGQLLRQKDILNKEGEK